MRLPPRPRLRPNVAICIINPRNEVLLVWSRQHRRNDWMFPQGGIEVGESLGQATRRELKEELGLVEVKLLLLRDRVYRYRWPVGLINRKGEHSKEGYAGQEQSLAIVRVPSTRPKLMPDPREATLVAWVPLAQFMHKLSPVRRTLGKIAMVELEKLIRPTPRAARITKPLV